MINYRTKLENLRKEAVKEGIVSDYLMYQTLKNWFDVPNMSYYQFGLLKQVILDFLKKQRIG